MHPKVSKSIVPNKLAMGIKCFDMIDTTMIKISAGDINIYN